MVIIQLRLFNYEVVPESVHDLPLEELPLSSHCWKKSDGISMGKICEVDGSTYYLKELPPLTYSMQERSARAGQPGLVSYEAFNRDFAKNNIGTIAPSSRFFKEAHYTGATKLYIASKKIENLTLGFFRGTIDSQFHSEPHNNALYTVARTFFWDLHEENYGYSNNKLVLIDVDSVNQIPLKLTDYLRMGMLGVKWSEYLLDLQDIKEMKLIYARMQLKPLPKFHDDFHLTNDMYQEILRIYIKACDDTILSAPTLNEGKKWITLLSSVWVNSVINETITNTSHTVSKRL